MATVTIQTKELDCRAHGGTFEVPVKAGRPPVNCREDNPCTEAPGAKRRKGSNPQAVARRTATSRKVPGTPPRMAAERPARGSGGTRPGRVAQAASTRQETRKAAPVTDEKPKIKKGKDKIKKNKIKSTESATVDTTRKPKPTLRGVNRTALRTGSFCKCSELDGTKHEKGIEGCRYATRKAPVVVTHNPCVPLVYDAKRLLEPQGWKLSGSKSEEDGEFYGYLIGQRGDETIALTWRNGKLIEQHYAMFQTDKPSATGMPRRKLDFNPDELSDVALVKKLSGRKVTFWNQLGKRQETVLIPHKSTSRIKVEHLMNGHGDEERRLVSFVDQTANHMAFRAFAVDALIKVQ